MKVVPSLVAIIACGGVGAWLGWRLVSVLGWTGLGAAFAAAFLAMMMATAMLAAIVGVRRVLRRPR